MSFLSSTGMSPMTSALAETLTMVSPGVLLRLMMRGMWWTMPGGTAWRGVLAQVSEEKGRLFLYIHCVVRTGVR